VQLTQDSEAIDSTSVPITGPHTDCAPPMTVNTTSSTMGSRPKSLECSTWCEVREEDAGHAGEEAAEHETRRACSG